MFRNCRMKTKNNHRTLLYEQQPLTCNDPTMEIKCKLTKKLRGNFPKIIKIFSSSVPSKSHHPVASYGFYGCLKQALAVLVTKTMLLAANVFSVATVDFNNVKIQIKNLETWTKYAKSTCNGSL